METEDERMEREAKAKEEAEAANRNQGHPITAQDFAQYIRMVEDGRRRDQETQNKFMEGLLTQAGAGRDNGARGVSLSDFQNARPLPFATAPEPMDAEDWLMDTERKLRTVGCNDEEKVAMRLICYLD